MSSLDLPEGTSLQRQRYQVHLLPQDTQTLITVHFADGTAANKISEEDARLILNQILSAYQVFRTTG